MPAPVLETPRLILRELTADDLDAVAATLADPEVMAFWPRTYTRDEAAAWIARQRERYARDGHGYWLAIERATGQPIGQAGLLTLQINGVADIGLGYILDRPHWGRGYATEAARACLDHAFATLLDPARRDAAPRVIAPIRPENAASRRVAARLGLTPGPTVPFAGYEHVIYGIGREEYETAKRGG